MSKTLFKLINYTNSLLQELILKKLAILQIFSTSALDLYNTKARYIPNNLNRQTVSTRRNNGVQQIRSMR